MSPLERSSWTWLRLPLPLPDGCRLAKEHFGGSKEFPPWDRRRKRIKKENANQERCRYSWPLWSEFLMASFCCNSSTPHWQRPLRVFPYLITRAQARRLQPDLHAALFLRSSLQGAMEAACWEISAQQAMVNNYFTVNLLVLLFLSSSPVNQRKTHWGFNFY